MSHSRVGRNSRRCALVAATACLALFSVSFALSDDSKPSEPKSTDSKPAKPEPAEKDRPLVDKLRDKTSFAFHDTELSEVAGYLAQKHSIPIVIDSIALKAARIDPDTPVRATIDNVTLRSALALVLQPLGLDWTIANEVVLVTTNNKLNNTLEVRIYPAADFVKMGFEVTGKDERSRHGDLREAIIATVAPMTWNDRGGPGTISWVPDGLVVRQTRAVHERVANLLDELREATGAAPPSEDAGAVEPTDVNRASARGEEISRHDLRAAERRIEQELLKSTYVTANDVTLRDVLEYLSQLHKLPMIFDTKAFGDAGIDIDDIKVSERFEGISLRSALNLILGKHGLDYLVENEVLKVTSRAQAEKSLLTRAYAIFPLVSERFTPRMTADVVVNAVGVEAWGNDEGMGAIASVPGCLVVRQSHPRHREIAALLKELEQNARSSAAAKRPVPPPNPKAPDGAPALDTKSSQ